MELLRASDVRGQPSAVFRESSVGKRVAFVLASTVFLALVAVGAGATGREASAPVLLFCVLGGATALLFAGIAWGALRATWRPSNWIVRLHREGLYVKFRSYLNHHFAAEDPVVAFLAANEVLWVRKTRERRMVPREDHEDREAWTFLDLRIEPADVGRLAEQLRVERTRQAPRLGLSRTRHHHHPVRLVDGGILRIEWKGPSTSVIPRIDPALERLGRVLAVEPEAWLEGRPLDGLDRREAEDRILELAEQGRTVEAVNLARRVHGCGLQEAREFVEGLVRG